MKQDPSGHYDNKKSAAADMDRRRLTFFLLGLSFVLTIFIVALEWNTGIDPDDKSSLDDMMQEIKLNRKDQDFHAAALPKPAKARRVRVMPDKVAADVPETVAKVSDDRLPEGENTTGVKDMPLPPENAPQVDAQIARQPLDLRLVEQIPEFPGGIVAFMKWLQKNLTYPETAQKDKIEGRVVVTFIINTDGSISDAKVKTSVDPRLDAEALRIVGMMPKWKPGIQNGKPCRTLFAIPIVFQL